MNIKFFKSISISLLVILLITFLFFLDFFRDYIFQNLNLQILYLSHVIEGVPNIDNYTDSSMESLLNGFRITDVVRLKYLSIFIFVILYFFLTLSFGFILIKDNIKKFIFFTCLLFIVVAIFSALMNILSLSFSGDIALAFYNISMELSHFIQSSLVVITMLVSYFIFLPSSKQTTKINK